MSEKSNNREQLLKLLDKNPHLEARFMAMLALMENVTGEYDRADDLEMGLVKEVTSQYRTRCSLLVETSSSSHS